MSMHTAPVVQDGEMMAADRRHQAEKGSADPCPAHTRGGETFCGARIRRGRRPELRASSPPKEILRKNRIEK